MIEDVNVIGQIETRAYYKFYSLVDCYGGIV